MFTHGMKLDSSTLYTCLASQLVLCKQSFKSFCFSIFLFFTSSIICLLLLKSDCGAYEPMRVLAKLKFFLTRVFYFRPVENWSENAQAVASSVLYAGHVILELDKQISSEAFLTNVNGVYSVRNVSGDGVRLVEKLTDEGEISKIGKN